eukprot:scaffold113629_cov69-Attheya_sp.AAC.3
MDGVGNAGHSPNAQINGHGYSCCGRTHSVIQPKKMAKKTINENQVKIQIYNQEDISIACPEEGTASAANMSSLLEVADDALLTVWWNQTMSLMSKILTQQWRRQIVNNHQMVMLLQKK